jgi:hypothetical protein
MKCKRPLVHRPEFEGKAFCKRCAAEAEQIKEEE